MPVRLTPRPAPDEMLTIRPKPLRFIEGATAWVRKKAPDRLTAKIACQSSSADFLDRPPDLAKDAAGTIDQDVDAGPVGLDRGDGFPDRRAVGDVEDEGLAVAGCGACALRQLRLEDIAGIDLGAAGGKTVGDGPAEAVGRAGDEGGAA